MEGDIKNLPTRETERRQTKTKGEKRKVRGKEW